MNKLQISKATSFFESLVGPARTLNIFEDPLLPCKGNHDAMLSCFYRNSWLADAAKCLPPLHRSLLYLLFEPDVSLRYFLTHLGYLGYHQNHCRRPNG